ncbi:MAG: carboxypeptidase-like regulatory domain-containing protein [Bacteroidales bacterium]|nr:carboxypeptidase-like regulatory domain-containing protein [Bacteroidales bacterium]
MRLKIKLLWIALLSSPLLVSGQQGNVGGTVADQQTGAALAGVAISVDGRSTGITTGSDGAFLVEVPAGEHLLYFDLAGYYQAIKQVTVQATGTTALGQVQLVPRPDVRQDAATITISDISDEGGSGSQGYQGILSSSADIFQSTAAYTFGPVRFRPRGYDQSYMAVMINGFLINDTETGNPIWSDWGGLNDVMRDAVVTNGPTATGHMFEPVGGLTRILTRASLYRPGIKMVYSLSNRTYNNRAMLTYSTGESEKGWSVTGSASRRWSQEGYVKGTFYDAVSLFMSVEKKFGEEHSLSFTALDAIYSRGVGGGSVQEAYDLAGSNYYNPYWGYQNGKVRNSRVRSSNKPLITLTHLWNIGDNSTLQTTAGYWFGKSGYTALNWYDTPDPRPDYYRYLPSYYTDPADQERVAAAWSDPLVSQINWNHFYFANGKNIATVADADGIAGNTVNGNRSKYIVEERRDDLSQYQFNTIFNHDAGNDLNLSGGLMVNMSKGFNYNIVKDLLGGDFWLDIDQFAERDFPDDPNIIQNDLNITNNIVGEGDTYSHSYVSHLNQGTLWGMGEWAPGKLKSYLQGHVTTSSIWREGKMRKGLFPDNSFGESEKLNYMTWGVKTGANYRITGRHTVDFNTALMKNPPRFSSAFLSPRTRNEVTPGIGSETIFTADASYILQTPALNARLTGYYTRFFNQSEVASFYHEELRTFINYSMTGIDKEHSGIELGIEWDITQTFSINGVAAIGQYLWMDNPEIVITRDNSSEVVRNDEVWVKYFSVDGTPQSAFSLGASYNAPSYWWAGITGSYFDRSYLSFNPVTRTQDETGYYPYWSEMQQVPSGFLIDAFVGKSWYLGKYYVVISANLSNLANRTDFQTGGFEQYRFDPERPELFAPKLYYYYGFNYFVNLSVRF